MQKTLNPAAVAKPKAALVFVRFYDVLCWTAFVLYLSGGISIEGRLAFSYVADVFRTVCGLGVLAVLFGADFSELTFVRAFKEVNDAIIEERTPRTAGGRALGAGMVYLVVLFFLAPLVRHWSYGTWKWDLGAIQQVIWRGANGHGLSSTLITDNPIPTDYFGGTHMSLWLYGIALVYKIFPYTETLLIAQSLALAGCLVPVWKIARKLSPKGWAPILWPVLFWLLETVHRVNVWDMHENAFIPFFTLWAFYFFLEEKWFLTAACTVAVSLFKEDAFVISGAMGFYFLLKRGHWKWASVCLVGGFLAFVGYSAGAHKVYGLDIRYAYLGKNFVEAKATLLHRPWVLIQQLFVRENWGYYGRTLLMFGGLWILGGWLLMVIAGPYFEIALTSYEPARLFTNHYIITMAGTMAFAAILGAGVLTRRFPKLELPKVRHALLTVLIGVAASQLQFAEPSYVRQIVMGGAWQKRACYSRLIEKIPSDVPLYASEPFVTHLANREVILSDLPGRNLSLPGSWAVIPEQETVPANGMIVGRDCGFVVARAK